MTYSYGIHLIWIVAVVLVQWVIGRKILLNNLKTIVVATLLIGTYYSLSDIWAIDQGIWFFNESLISGVSLGPMPLEEAIFFYATSMLVAQSLILFLPSRLRR